MHLLKTRLSMDNRLHEMYFKAVNDYIVRGYAELAGIAVSRQTWFLSNHPVTHSQKPDKVRIILGYASRCEGISPNDRLLSGPDILNSLVGVLLHFRQFSHVVTADIEAMFHQVKIPEIDKDALLFLWWEGSNLSVTSIVYRMTFHYFGAESSPSCASWALNRSIENNRDMFSHDNAIEAMRSLHVDDLLFSAHSSTQLVFSVERVRKSVSTVGFRLTKWSSNVDGGLKNVHPDDRAHG